MTTEPGAALDQPATPPHKSTSTVQAEVEVHMLTTLSGELGKQLEKRPIAYHGAKMEIDGVDASETVFVEAFAHIGTFKSGHRRKVATDILKFVALQADRPKARFVLAFADEAAKTSVVGWVRAVADHHGIELTVIEVPEEMKEKLAAAQVDQRAGMETQ